MSDFKGMVVRQKRWMQALIVLVLIGVLFASDQHFFIGLLFGTVISYFNLWLLQKKASVLISLENIEDLRKGFGTISRVAASVLGVLITIHYDLSIAGYLIGLMTAYPVIMLDLVVFHRK